MRIAIAIGALLLLAGLVRGQDSLEGKITGGKALKLVQKALPLLREGQAAMTNASRMPVDEGPEYEALLNECILKFDEGTLLLNEALDLQYDGGINAMLVNAAKKMAWARARLLRLENKRRFQNREPVRPSPEPEPKPGPEPEPEPNPESKPEPDGEARPNPEAKPERVPVEARKFASQRPPAEPGLYDLNRAELPDTKEQQSRAKRAIQALLKAHYTARKPGKLLARCRLCGGKGTFKDGGSCEACAGSGSLINLHHFRKVFWTSYSPLLRDQAGALEALRSFYGHAREDPSVLGPEVKSFKLREVKYRGDWAEVVVDLNTSEGRQRHAITLIGIGSSWFFYCPDADRELLEAGE